MREFAKQMNQKGLVIDANESLKISDNPSLKTGLVDANGKPHPMLSHCSEDVLEFYQKNADCFSILSPEQIPKNLEWQDGSNEKEFSSPDAKRGGLFMPTCEISPELLEQLDRMQTVGFAAIFWIIMSSA